MNQAEIRKISSQALDFYPRPNHLKKVCFTDSTSGYPSKKNSPKMSESDISKLLELFANKGFSYSLSVKRIGSGISRKSCKVLVISLRCKSNNSF
jgi:hypothetical protein